MKRFFALMAVVLAVVSCQKDVDNLDVNMGGGQLVDITISLPETTRAQSNLGFQIPDDLGSNYDLRYILEIYLVENGVIKYDTCQRFVENSTQKQIVFPVRLVAERDYKIVAWADIVAKGSKEDRYYYTQDGLDNVVIMDNGNVNWNAMDETRDAYTDEKLIEDFNSSSVLNLTLTRPFAKIRVVATDIDDVLKVGIVPTTAEVEYIDDMPYKYNAVADNGGYAFNEVADKTHSYAYATTATKYTDQSGEYTLFTDYIFVPTSGTSKFTLMVKDAQGREIKSNTFNTEISVERNKLTTIKGDVLTTGGNVKVTIDNGLAEKETYNVIDSATSFQDAIEEIPDGGSANIELGGDIDLGDLFGAGILSTRAATPLPIVIPEGRTLVLNLNGFTISTPFVDGSTTNHTYAFENHGSLTIEDSKGTGKIVARGIFNYGTMTLNAGTIDACDGNGGYGVRNYEGATFVMNGGAIVTSIEDDNMVDKGGYDATTLRIDEGATAEINAGIINNICDYTFAIDNYGATTVNGGTMTSIHSTVSSYGNMTINGGSFTCNGLEGVSAHALVTWDGSVTNIYGGTFDGKDNYNGFNVDACAGALVNIYGGKFLPVHSGSLYGEGTIIVKGGTFFDQIAESRIDSDYKLVESGENWVVEKKPAIAKIGDVEYTSLAKAVAAVQDGDTITLVANEVFTEKNYFDNGGWKDGLGYAGDRSFTIDLNNNTVSQNGYLNDYLFWIKNVGSKANTITIKNGTLDAGTTAFCALCTASSHDNQLTINLENVNLINKKSDGSTIKVRAGSVVNVNAGTKITGKDSYLGIENWNATVNVYDGAEIYMNGTSSYNGCLIGVGGNGTVNVYGGYGKGVSGGLIAMTSGGTINVSGGEWIANTDGTYANSNKSVLVAQSDKQYNAGAGNAVVNVTGGTFKGGYNCYGNAVGDAQINIKGGNFNANPASYVVAGYESVEENGIYTVAKPKALADFEAAIANGGNVTLASDVTLLETIVIENEVVIDLNGKTVTAPLFSAFNSKAGGNLTIKNGKVVAYESTVRAVGGKATIESGEYTSTGTALDSPATYRYSLDCREGGELIINGGTFKSNNGMINVSSTVTINGGKFENIVEKAMTRHFAYVSAPLTINDGEFLGKANGAAGGCFFCGAAAGCDIQVNGGKFTSLWTSGSVNRIFEVYYGGTINVTGGLFNTNGGISTFVTANTDEATKAQYPYVAK